MDNEKKKFFKFYSVVWDVQVVSRLTFRALVDRGTEAEVAGRITGCALLRHGFRVVIRRARAGTRDSVRLEESRWRTGLEENFFYFVSLS